MYQLHLKGRNEPKRKFADTEIKHGSYTTPKNPRLSIRQFPQNISSLFLYYLPMTKLSFMNIPNRLQC